MDELRAGVGRCEEASSLSHGKYIPCNAPATRMVALSGEGPYRMCDEHTHHSVRNRGGTDLGPYEGPPADVKPRVFGTGSDDLAAYAADAAPDADAENILARITRVARELRQAQEDVNHAAANLKSAQDRVRVIEEGTLPELMDEAGQRRLTTVDGYELERGETLRASIPPVNAPRAIMWLNANGQAAIVKREMKLDFGKGEDQKAAHALEVLLGEGFRPADKQFVHPQTLGATIRELLAAGVEVPMDLLGAYVQAWVKMKAPEKPLPKKATAR